LITPNIEEKSVVEILGRQPKLVSPLGIETQKPVILSVFSYPIGAGPQKLKKMSSKSQL